MAKGIVYILTNPSFDSWVKIGMSARNDIESRLAELNRPTNLPLSYRAYAAYEVDRPQEVEKHIHNLFDIIDESLHARETLASGRVRDREFFRISPERAFAVFKVVSQLRKDEKARVKEEKAEFHVGGFNSIFAVSNSFVINGQRISPVQLYYEEFKRQICERNSGLRIATIFSFAANEEEPDTTIPDEDFDNDKLDPSTRDFLERAIADYNAMFGMMYDTSPDKFQNYYKDVSLRIKNREIDLLIVVNMFLTGFGATTLNTLWVDKNLKSHGLIQAFSRTNRILNSVKTFGNIVCFRNLKKATDAAIALFGDREAGDIVLLKTYNDYYNRTTLKN